MRRALVLVGVACAGRGPAPAAAPSNAAPPRAAAPAGCTPRLLATGDEVAVGEDASITFRRGARLVFAGVVDGEAAVAPADAPGWRAPAAEATRVQLATDVVIDAEVVVLAGAWVAVRGAAVTRGVVRPTDTVRVAAAGDFAAEIACADLAEVAVRVERPVPATPRRLADEIDLVGAAGSLATLPAGMVVDVLQSTGADARVRAVVDDVALTGWVPCSVVLDVPCTELYGRIGALAYGTCAGGIVGGRAGDECTGRARLRAAAPLWTSPPYLEGARALPSVARPLDVTLLRADDDARMVELTAPAPGVERATVWVSAEDLDRETCP